MTLHTSLGVGSGPEFRKILLLYVSFAVHKNREARGFAPSPEHIRGIGFAFSKCILE